MDDSASLDELVRFLEAPDDGLPDLIASDVSIAPLDVSFDPSLVDFGLHFVDHSNEADRDSSDNNGALVPTRAPGRRKKKNNSNRARDERRHEIAYLRKHVSELEQILAERQSRHGSNANHALVLAKTAMTKRLKVWKDIAEHQRAERLRVEEENAELKAALASQLQVKASLERIFNRRSISAGMRLCRFDTAKTETVRDFGPAVVQELIDSVNTSFDEIDAICQQIGITQSEFSYCDSRMREGEHGGLVLEVYQNKVLPFTAMAAGELVWKNFSQIMSQVPFRRFYERRNADAVVPEDMVIETMGMESRLNNTSLEIHGLQVLRRYVETDRVAILWSNVQDAVKFTDKPLEGRRFHHRGFLLLRKPKSLDPNEYCVLTTCYIIQPKWARVDDLTREMINFLKMEIAAGTAANHQHIENMLLRNAMAQHRAVVQC
ncbi:hypothetical protein Poli38472_000510 [Pythium oligandrum]|uniref:Uncharacterized protein n=1 Tax=Pythium oligandrum TaxID=41045 RepID=A0A8K1CCG4_PYTOL|nr:hypothetical protein Poli38472_000510 [Pythium oligandrum]|eukprot:TMW60468.1 hypothetical protein Poli38472_000510 [Pythium oligandrum]